MKDWQEHEAIYKVYTEAKQFEAGKYHPRFGKTSQELRSRGVSVPSRDAIHFISNLLEYVNIFSEEETDSVVKNNSFAEKRMRFLELLDIHSEEIKSSAADIEENYSSQFDQYFKIESANRGQRGRGDKYSANAAAIEMAKQQKEELQKLKSMASGGAADSLNILSAGLDQADKDLGETLGVSLEDPTFMFEIKLKNPGFADKVVNFLKPFAGDSEIESYGTSIEFSAEPDSQIAKLVAKIGREKVEDTINDWLDDNTTGGIAIIVTPDEPGFAEELVAPGKRKAPIFEPENTDEREQEYGDNLPDAPEMGDEERYYPRSSSRPSFTGDDEDYGGDSDYTPRWAREEEEHEGARRSPEEGDHGLDYDKEAYNDESDLDDDGELSEYEKKRGSAIKRAMGNKKDKKEENNENIKMSPQQMNQWMYNQRTSRMQNNLRQNERWGNY
jgi:hypothetical protein